ncbi:MAG TPA: GGDEF domain-containing protein [bacterium]|nr:GGDEF domain-containing protein [bacterium]
MTLDLTSDINRSYARAMNYRTIDLFMIKILWWHFGFTVLMAFTNSYLRLSAWLPSPFSWRILSSTEALTASMIGFLAAAVPTVVWDRLRNHYAWRLIMNAALTVYSYLFVFMSGGSIEMHFHFFMVMALVTVYSDWRLGWFVLVLTALHHGILNYVAPNWVYVYGRNDVAVLAHGLPVLATAIFTTLLCNSHRRSVATSEEARRALQQEMEERVRAQEAATTDALTGLANRRGLLDRLHSELQRSARSNSPLCVVSIDLDGFKAINDAYGHAIGDQVLSSVGDILRGYLRQTDVAARYGGDEFVLLLCNTTPVKATVMLSRLATFDLAPTDVDHGGHLDVQFSWGIASWPEDGDIADQLLQTADHRLYEMKRRPRSSAKTIS